MIKETEIEKYKEQHKIFYNALNSMIFDIAFIEACVDLEDRKLCNDWITIKILHRNIFENLISKVHRCFFDNTENDSITLFQFKNNVIGKFLKPEYRNEIRDITKKVSLTFDDFKNRKKVLETNIRFIRHHFIAHRQLTIENAAIADLNEIKMLVEYGQLLFQTLSFGPLDFYSLMEGNGYDFSKETDFLHKSTQQFIKTSFLTSKYITKIHCDFDDTCNDSEKQRLQTIIDDLNSNR